jgi:adenine-specific DNA methylase
MELILSNTKTQLNETFKILKFRKIAEPKGLIIVFHNYIDDEDIGKFKTYELQKVEFIAACKTNFDDNELLIAFYINADFGLITPHVLNAPVSYSSHRGDATMVNYDAYLKMCKLTGENPYSFKEYFRSVQRGHVLNDFTEFKGSLFSPSEVFHIRSLLKK